MSVLYDKCPICKNSENAVLLNFDNSRRFLFEEFRQINLQKRICKQCSHIYAERYHSFEELENHYQNTRNSKENLIYNKNDKLDKLFLNLVQWFDDQVRLKGATSGFRVLDVGCGKCDLLRSFGEFYPKAELYGVDFSPQSFSLGEKKGLENIFIGDFIEHPFDGLDFKIISATGILEHQIDLDAFLKKIVTLSSDGSYFLLEVPESHAIIKQRPDLKAKFMHDICNDEHVHHFNLANLNFLLRQYGFNIHASRTIRRGDWEALDVLCKYYPQPQGASSQQSSIKFSPSKAEDLFSIFSKRRKDYIAKFQQMVSRFERLGIYGCGWHTSVLLPAFFEMNFENVTTIFDQDQRKTGKRLFDIPISFPEYDKMQDLDAILISSINMEASICDYLISLGVPSEKIIRLYETLN